MLTSGLRVYTHTHPPYTYEHVYTCGPHTCVKVDIEDSLVLFILHVYLDYKRLKVKLFYYFKCLSKETHNNDAKHHF